MSIHRTVGLRGLLCWTALLLVSADPVGWRKDGSGRYPQANPPVEWSAENHIRWKTEMPGSSHTSPVLVGDRLIVTSDPAELLCVSAETGEILWQRPHLWADLFDAAKAEEIARDHQKAEALQQEQNLFRKEMDARKKDGTLTEEEQQQLQTKIDALETQRKALLKYPPPKKGGAGNTTPTPISDGNAVYTVFAHGLASAHDLDGNRLWMKHLEGATDGFGHSASPVLVGNTLVVHLRELWGLNAETGEVKWKTNVPVRWGSLLVTEIGATPVVITPSGVIVAAETGEILAEKLFGMDHNTPILEQDILYAFQNGKNLALRLPKSAGEQPEKIWEEKGFNQRTFSSPLYHEGLLYVVSERGILDVVDAKTGELVYRERLDVGDGRVYSSITLAGENLFVGTDKGVMLVFKPGREYEQVARNELEGFSCSPVFSGSRMYLRTYKHLICVEE